MGTLISLLLNCWNCSSTLIAALLWEKYTLKIFHWFPGLHFCVPDSLLCLCFWFVFSDFDLWFIWVNVFISSSCLVGSSESMTGQWNICLSRPHLFNWLWTVELLVIGGLVVPQEATEQFHHYITPSFRFLLHVLTFKHTFLTLWLFCCLLIRRWHHMRSVGR